MFHHQHLCQMRLIITLFIGILFGQPLFAQDTVFSVLAVNGTCMIQRGANPDEFVRVESKIKIYQHDKIIVTGSSSYIGLVAPSGKVAEITKSGVFATEDLMAELVTGNVSLANEYTRLMVSNLTSEKFDQAKYNMYAGGSIDRSSGEKSIQIFLPANTKISDEASLISWDSKKSISNYQVSITNLYEEVVFSANTVEKSLMIDFSSIDLLPGHVYRVQVSEVGNPSNKSNEVALQVPTRSDLAKFQTDLKMLQTEVPKNSAIGDMVMATYLEEQGLFLQAIPYYRSAINKEPKIVEYKHAYDVFLYKIGLEN